MTSHLKNRLPRVPPNQRGGAGRSNRKERRAMRRTEPTATNVVATVPPKSGGAKGGRSCQRRRQKRRGRTPTDNQILSQATHRDGPGANKAKEITGTRLLGITAAPLLPWISHAQRRTRGRVQLIHEHSHASETGLAAILDKETSRPGPMGR